MLQGIYTFVVGTYFAGIRLASFFHTKAKLWVTGRRNWREHLRKKMKSVSQPVIWVHCASYGEFEQGRPLIEKIYFEKKEYFILITFFSPSGKEAFKDYPHAHAVEYLPADTPGNARDFLDITRPEIAVFIRYEFWLNYLAELRKRKISHFLVSAVFKPHHPFFRWYGGIFRESLKGFSEIFVQDEASLKLLQQIGIKNIALTGDSRVDRVLKIKHQVLSEKKKEKEYFPGNPNILVAGSIWEEDLHWLLRWWGIWKKNIPELRGILVPHEVDRKTIDQLIRLIHQAGFSFRMWEEEMSDRDFILVDKVGILSKLYSAGQWAYVGGAMGKGIHNILEPAVYGIPVLCCGSNFSNFIEAEELRALSVLHSYLPEEDASHALLNSLNRKNEIEKISSGYFEKKSGATDTVFEKIFTISGFDS